MRPTLVERLQLAIATASNDDYSEAMTEKRRRHVERLDTMTDAMHALRALEHARQLCERIVEHIGVDHGLSVALGREAAQVLTMIENAGAAPPKESRALVASRETG